MTFPILLADRLRRQRLIAPLAKPDGYLDLFAALQPVSTIYFTRPGDPPRLPHRTRFDDGKLADRFRADRTIVKGRFLHGGIGYVRAADLGLYANAFARPVPRPSSTQQRVLDALRGTGPLTPRQLKEETGLLNKDIMPALHRLQQAFLVFEDQADSDWERPWATFAGEWPDVAVEPSRFARAAAEVLARFLHAHVFATLEQIRDWSGLPLRHIKLLLPALECAGRAIPHSVAPLGPGWLAPDAISPAEGEPPACVFMLDKADFLVRSHASALKRAYAGREVLQYLLIDGRFQGAVLGHWRIGPHDVDDIVVDLPLKEKLARRDEVLAAVSEVYRPPRSRVLRYGGKKV